MTSYKAPILITLRDLDAKKSDLKNFICENILNNNLSPSDKYLIKLLKEGNFLFFLDGYDEIKSDDKHEITKNIENFIDAFPKNNYILTSRPYSNIEYFKNFENLYICDLSEEEQVLFIEKQIIDKRLSSKIIQSIQESKGQYINSFFKNHLLLTLYIMAYSKNSSIPNKKYIFYRRVFDVLFSEHDSATKIGFEREIKTQLNQESVEIILQIFSFLSYFDNQFDFNKDYIFNILNTIKEKNTSFKYKNIDFIEDMKLSIGLWIEDCGLYTFSHRSMQEYFTAVYISKLSQSNKKKVYKKIVILVKSGSFDLNNLLSLCYELDKKEFIRNYSLKIIQEIKKLYLKGTNIYNYSLGFMNNGFRVRKENKKNSWSYSVTNELRILIETHITPEIRVEENLNAFTNLFVNNINNPLFTKYIKINKICLNKDGSHQHHENVQDIINLQKLKESESYEFILPKRIEPDYILYLKEIGIGNIIDKEVKKLITIEKKLKEELLQEENEEDAFITMI
jgi:hypothetical protein